MALTQCKGCLDDAANKPNDLEEITDCPMNMCSSSDKITFENVVHEMNIIDANLPLTFDVKASISSGLGVTSNTQMKIYTKNEQGMYVALTSY